MTTTEKAKELVEKFECIVATASDKWSVKDEAKRCALIAVDEILEIVSSDESAIIVELQYWQQVKEEIEQL
jgi:hypothetical protein